MAPIATREIEAFLHGISAHEITLVAELDPQYVYAGNVVYRASNGWTIVIFNDANEYDYIDSIESTDGRRIELEQIDDVLIGSWESLAGFDDAVAWRCFGIPGYCIFRCTQCGAQIPDAVERGRPMVSPFLCGDSMCIGKQDPANGTWVRVAP